MDRKLTDNTGVGYSLRDFSDPIKTHSSSSIEGNENMVEVGNAGYTSTEVEIKSHRAHLNAAQEALFSGTQSAVLRVTIKQMPQRHGGHRP